MPIFAPFLSKTHLMKILQLTKQFPYPTKDGYTVAVTCLAKALNQLDCEVTLLAMNTTKHWFDLSKLPTDFNHYHKIHTVKIDNRITPLGAFLNLFSETSFILSRFITEDFSKKLKVVLQSTNFDIVQLESIQLAPYIPIIRQFSKAKISMRAHNVEFEIWERQLEQTQSLLKRLYLKSQITSFKKFEIESLEKLDILAAITTKDLDNFRKLGFKNEGIAIPVGIDSEEYKTAFKSFSSRPSFGFIGSMDWMPNQIGIEWFLDKAWPIFTQKYPQARFEIAGRNVPPNIARLFSESVNVLGEVESAKDFMDGHSVMIAPLFSGSGIRVKILEGMALGRVIISTSIGMEGIDAQHRKEILVANTPEEYLREMTFCMENPEILLEIGKNARLFIQNHFDNLNIGQQLKQVYEKTRAK
jgi:glycosyltransferase involved in cell wall biosynthesis